MAIKVLDKNLNFCIVTHEYPPQIGGVGNSTHRIANLLAEYGLSIHVVVFSKSKDPIPFDESITTSKEGSVTTHRAKVWCPQRKHENLESDDRPYSVLEDLTQYNREMFDVLVYLHKRFNYSLLHGFFLYPSGFVATMVARYLGIKSIVSIRGNDIGKYTFDSQRLKFIEQALRNADYVTSVAESLLKMAERVIFPSNGRSQVILNSVEIPDNQSLKIPTLPLKGNVIGTAGIFRYKKGLLYLFKALSKLNGQIDFTLLLLGDFFDDYERKLHMKYLQELGLKEKAVITGRLEHKDFLSYLQLCDIFVIPSLFSEGCPLVLLEGMSVKRPIIASRTGEIPEIVQDGKSGILVEPGSSEDIYQNLVRLLEDDSLRNMIGEGAKLRVQELSPERELREWLGVYKAVLE